MCPAPQRAQLLQFCTGSARAPATGFAELMGYGGNQQRFCLQRVRTLRRALATSAHARSREDKRILPHRAALSLARLAQQVEGEAGRLPTAATCFNTLRLPACEATLATR